MDITISVPSYVHGDFTIHQEKSQHSERSKKSVCSYAVLEPSAMVKLLLNQIYSSENDADIMMKALNKQRKNNIASSTLYFNCNCN